MPSRRCGTKKLICAVTVLAVSAAQSDTIFVDAANCLGPGEGSEAMAQSAFSTYGSTGSQPTIVPTKVIPVSWILRTLMMRRACWRSGAPIDTSCDVDGDGGPAGAYGLLTLQDE